MTYTGAHTFAYQQDLCSKMIWAWLATRPFCGIDDLPAPAGRQGDCGRAENTIERIHGAEWIEAILKNLSHESASEFSEYERMLIFSKASVRVRWWSLMKSGFDTALS
jgi:hypothetical protein